VPEPGPLNPSNLLHTIPSTLQNRTMAEPATQPNPSSHVKPRKLKTPKEKSQLQHQRQNQVAVSSDAVGATTGPTSAAAVVSVAATPKNRGILLAEADYDVEFGDFDYDAVKADEGAELWLVRAPTSVKAKNLHGLDVAHRMGLVGDLIRKNAAFDMWALEPAVGEAVQARASGSGIQSELGGAEGTTAHVGHVGAEELNNLSVLLPCKRKGGKLYLAPKPITRHLVVAARPAKPTKPDAASDATATVFENPKREAYPDEVLTHRFRPYGDPGDPPPENLMEVDAMEANTKEKERHKRRGGGEIRSPMKKKAKLVTS